VTIAARSINGRLRSDGKLATVDSCASDLNAHSIQDKDMDAVYLMNAVMCAGFRPATQANACCSITHEQVVHIDYGDSDFAKAPRQFRCHDESTVDLDWKKPMSLEATVHSLL
jgi:hypothetical protein